VLATNQPPPPHAPLSLILQYHGDDRKAIELDGWDYDMVNAEVPKATLAGILHGRGGKGKAPAKSAATGLTKAMSHAAGNQGKWPHPSGRKGDKVSFPLLPLRHRSHYQCGLFPHPLLPHQCGLCGALWNPFHHSQQFQSLSKSDSHLVLTRALHPQVPQERQVRLRPLHLCREGIEGFTRERGLGGHPP
jgi:hypothetical protein